MAGRSWGLWPVLPIVLLLAAEHTGTAGGARLEGEVPVGDVNLGQFIGKFCFDYNTANVSSGLLFLETTFVLSTAKKSGSLYIMVFDDETQHWKDAWRSWADTSCEYKKDMSSTYKKIPLTPSMTTYNYTLFIFEKLRPRFWYIAVVGCDVGLDGPLRYKLHMTNRRENESGVEDEFSFDRRGMLNVYGWSTLWFTLATLLTGWCALWRPAVKDTDMRDHPYVRLLLTSFVASSSSCAAFFLHYWAFSSDGYGSKRVRFIGVLVGVVANCTIFLIAILASVGWAISTGELVWRRTFLGMVFVVGAISALCELRAEATIDESTKIYSYQSTAGMLALMLKIFMFCWFAHNIMHTYEIQRVEMTKRFYKVLGATVTFWALNIPVTVLLAFLISPWYRYKVVTTVDIVARLCGQLLLAQLLCGPLSPIIPRGRSPMVNLGGEAVSMESFVTAPT